MWVKYFDIVNVMHNLPTQDSRHIHLHVYERDSIDKSLGEDFEKIVFSAMRKGMFRKANHDAERQEC